MLVLALDLSVESGVNKFKDVSETDWFLPYVGVANSFGIVQGENETTFGVGKPISRQDMTVMVYRALSRLGKAKLPSELADKFADDGDIAQYARKAVYVLKSYGIIDGVGENRFAPGELCTKAQAAKILSEISK